MKLVLSALVLAVATTAFARPAAAEPLDGNLPNHRCGMGLDGVSFYLTYSPFNDLVKSMRFIDVGSWTEDGLPASAADGKTARGRVGVDNAEPFSRGEYVLTWTGQGEVALSRPGDAKLVSELFVYGAYRRVYDLPDGPGNYGLEIEFRSFPVADVHLFIPGGEDAKGLWNPDYLRVIEPFRGTHLRFMDLNSTNHSEQKEWSDRTPRGWATYQRGHNNAPSEPIKGEVPYEAMIELCNATDTDLWVTVPHLATPEYMANLAHLIRTGVDRATGAKTTEPLREDLRVWLEYSNEVWNWNFDQSDWVNDNVPGDKLDDKYARKALEVFAAFEKEFGGTDRLVRVIATQTGYGDGWRSQQRLQAVKDQGGEADALAITTYFAHDLEQWIVDHWPVTIEQALDELESRIGSGPFVEDGLHERNEQKVAHYRIAEEFGVPVVAYEGGPHFLPERPVVAPGTEAPAEGVKLKKTKATKLVPELQEFIQTMERTPRFGEIYQQFLARHHASGLRINTPFVLVAGWRDSGQWGHVESLTQPLEEAVKYQALLEFYHLPQPPSAASTGSKRSVEPR